MNIRKISKLVGDGNNEALNEYLMKQTYKSAKREGLIKGFIIGGCLGVVLVARILTEANAVNYSYSEEDQEQ